jgi:GGDEF domain-containing protein
LVSGIKPGVFWYSLGVAAYHTSTAIKLRIAVHADAAPYKVKQNGRNRVELA